jgi:hypothetical protein
MEGISRNSPVNWIYEIDILVCQPEFIEWISRNSPITWIYGTSYPKAFSLPGVMGRISWLAYMNIRISYPKAVQLPGYMGRISWNDLPPIV